MGTTPPALEYNPDGTIKTTATTAAPATDASTASTAPALGSGSNIDWSKTGWNVGTGKGSQWYTPPENMYGFQIGSSIPGQSANGGVGYSNGYVDPTSGKITYNTNAPTPDNQNNVTQVTYQYDANADYGLGTDAIGIIPLEHNAQGQVTQFFAPTATGGYQAFGSLQEAKDAIAQYKTWAAGTKQGVQTATPATTSTAPVAPPAKAHGQYATPTYNDLSLPGAGETYYDNTKDLYGQPTNAQKLLDSLAPMGTTNAQTVFNETPNQPSAQEQQWNAYSGIYGDPHYLDDYYARQQQKAQTTLDRKAASGGWGDSGAAAKATGNLGAVYGDMAIKGMEDFSKTGMGLAGASDAGFTQRTQLRGSLGTAADSANNNQLSTRAGIATGADSANLAQTSGGQVAANSAQTDQQNRVNGGIDRLTALGNDQAALAAAGMSAADSELFSTQLAAMQGQWTAAGLTAQQQYQKAQELMTSLGIVGNAASSYYLSTKFGQKTQTPYQSPVGPMPAGSQ